MRRFAAAMASASALSASAAREQIMVRVDRSAVQTSACTRWKRATLMNRSQSTPAQSAFSAVASLGPNSLGPNSLGRTYWARTPLGSLRRKAGIQRSSRPSRLHLAQPIFWTSPFCTSSSSSCPISCAHCSAVTSYSVSIAAHSAAIDFGSASFRHKLAATSSSEKCRPSARRRNDLVADVGVHHVADPLE